MDVGRFIELIFAGGVGGILLALTQYVRARGQNRNEARALGNTADAQQRDYLLKLQELTNADERDLREALSQMWAETRQQLREEQQKRAELDARLTETQKQLTTITIQRDEIQRKYDQALATSDELQQKYDKAMTRIRQLEKEVAELKKEHST